MGELSWQVKSVLWKFHLFGDDVTCRFWETCYCIWSDVKQELLHVTNLFRIGKETEDYPQRCGLLCSRSRKRTWTNFCISKGNFKNLNITWVLSVKYILPIGYWLYWYTSWWFRWYNGKHGNIWPVITIEGLWISVCM